jgi:hypothetical protein
MEALDATDDLGAAALDEPSLTGGLVEGEGDIGVIVKYELHANPLVEGARAVACIQYYETRSMQGKAKLRPS